MGNGYTIPRQKTTRGGWQIQYITKCQKWYQEVGAAAYALAVLSLVVLAATGAPAEEWGGWIACPPWVIEGQGSRAKRYAPRKYLSGLNWEAGRWWLRQQWMVTAVRSEALLVLATLSGYQTWDWICLLPWAVWLWKGLGVACPGLRRQLWYLGLGRLMEEVSRLALVGLGLIWLVQHSTMLQAQCPWTMAVGQVGAPVASQRPSIQVEQD
jgi:hypothetical protein